MSDRTILDMFRLDGKVAIVTGASSGLGAVFARTLAEAGADVVLGARRAERLVDTQKAVEATGRRAIAVPTDVSRPEDCQALVDAAMAEFGKVDVLVNNAGVGTAYPATRETPEQFRQVIDVVDVANAGHRGPLPAEGENRPAQEWHERRVLTAHPDLRSDRGATRP